MNRHERRAASRTAKAKGLPKAGGASAQINNGIAAINAGNLKLAEETFRQILKADPNMVEAKHQLGTVLARTGRADEGAQLLREVTAALPNEALYWSNLAAACYIGSDTAGAIEAARRAVSLQPDYGLAWDNLGSALMDNQEFVEAIHAFNRAIEHGAGDVETMKRLSGCYFGAQDYGNAIRIMRDILANHGDDPEIMASLGAALIEAQDYPAARDTLAKAAGITPDHFPTAYHFGRVLRLTGDMTAALRWLRRATSADPRNPVAWRDLADALFESGDIENAKVAIERAISLEPNAVSIRDLAVRILGPGAAEEPVFNLDLPALGLFAPMQLTTAKEAAAPKPDESGVVDLSILKIGA
ncbi:MAG: tetratricopeptide repeat protein [Rhodospirillaceae bacterium]|nr:tetratricopeptide repeat protein [Rhodospirillaceae bacterium]